MSVSPLDYLFLRDPIWGVALPDVVALPSAQVAAIFGLWPPQFTR